MNIEQYIRSECDRQYTKNYEAMKDAFDLANGYFGSVESLVCALGHKVEPEKNPRCWRIGTGFSHNYRTSHVGFMFGPSACPTGEVPLRMERWNEFAESILDRNYECSVEDADSLIKTLLDIHPFVDGNGRVASILRNLMIGSMDDPQPLPYYYGNA